MGTDGTNNRLVSVVVPTYNRAHLLPRAIRSVLNQTYDEYELVIVDDGSTDDTQEVVSQFGDERIRYVRFEENRGANAARNRGVSEAAGEYVSFLDSDDELTEKHLEAVVDRLEQSPAAVAGACTGCEIVTENGTVPSIHEVRDAAFELEDILHCNVIGSISCTTFQRSVFEEVGCFDERLPSSQDHDLYIRVLKDYRIAAIDKILTRYHVHGDQISYDLDRRTTGRKRLVEKHSPLVSETRTQKEHVEAGTWDWLLVCSGGRYDVLTDLSDRFFSTDTFVTRVIGRNVGDISDWMEQMFPGTYDGLFVDGGEPVYWRENSEWDERDHFETVPHYTEFEVSDGYARCSPEQVNAVVRAYLDDHDGGVVRYLQPQPPFREIPEWTRGEATRRQRTANAVRAGELSLEAVAAAYRDNFAWMLEDGVADLLPDLGGRVVMTADHGECLGDCGQWFHERGHDPHLHLATVPWAIIQDENSEHGDRRRAFGRV